MLETGQLVYSVPAEETTAWYVTVWESVMLQRSPGSSRSWAGTAGGDHHWGCDGVWNNHMGKNELAKLTVMNISAVGRLLWWGEGRWLLEQLWFKKGKTPQHKCSGISCYWWILESRGWCSGFPHHSRRPCENWWWSGGRSAGKASKQQIMKNERRLLPPLPSSNCRIAWGSDSTGSYCSIKSSHLSAELHSPFVYILSACNKLQSKMI